MEQSQCTQSPAGASCRDAAVLIDRRLAVRNGSSESRALIATQRIEAGEVIAALGAASESPAPARHTVQIGPALHILPDPECLRYTNHSCDPNVVFDTELMQVRTIRAVESGSEICYFYPSTEWHMASPFRCDCGSDRCLIEITGASHLDDAVLRRYDLAPHISELLDGRAHRANGTGLGPQPRHPDLGPDPVLDGGRPLSQRELRHRRMEA